MGGGEMSGRRTKRTAHELAKGARWNPSDPCARTTLLALINFELELISKRQHVLAWCRALCLFAGLTAEASIRFPCPDSARTMSSCG